MDWGEIAFQGMQLALPVVMAFVGWLSVKLTNWIKVKIENEQVEGVLVRLVKAAETVVKSQEQTVVDAIRRANADGKITDAEKKAIGEASLADLKSLIGPRGLKLLGYVVGGGNLDSFLVNHLEAAVHDMKTVKKAVDSEKK